MRVVPPQVCQGLHRQLAVVYELICYSDSQYKLIYYWENLSSCGIIFQSIVSDLNKHSVLNCNPWGWWPLNQLSNNGGAKSSIFTKPKARKFISTNFAAILIRCFISKAVRMCLGAVGKIDFTKILLQPFNMPVLIVATIFCQKWKINLV